jgi:hypothetical protein
MPPSVVKVPVVTGSFEPRREMGEGTVTGSGEVPSEVVDALRSVCLPALSNAGPPFFRPAWGSDVVGMVLGAGVEWEEVAELLTESYCVLAPKKLAGLVERPGG